MEALSRLCFRANRGHDTAFLWSLIEELGKVRDGITLASGTRGSSFVLAMPAISVLDAEGTMKTTCCSTTVERTSL